MGSAWLDHVKKTSVANPGLMKSDGFKAILKLAGKTWKKGTGAVSSVGKTTKRQVGTRKVKGKGKGKGKETRREGKGKGKGKGTRREGKGTRRKM